MGQWLRPGGRTGCTVRNLAGNGTTTLPPPAAFDRLSGLIITRQSIWLREALATLPARPLDDRPLLPEAPILVRCRRRGAVALRPAVARMTDASDDRRDFFVSFNQADRDWATWIAWELEANGYSVFFQDWDFRGSFVEQMHQATLRAERVLTVLSDNYLRSEYARSEAWAALARDPVGREDRVITVKVGPTRDLGLFSQFAYTDLTNRDETEARERLLGRVSKTDRRDKPRVPPEFPGGATRPPWQVSEKPSFPPVHDPLATVAEAVKRKSSSAIECFRYMSRFTAEEYASDLPPSHKLIFENSRALIDEQNWINIEKPAEFILSE